VGARTPLPRDHFPRAPEDLHYATLYEHGAVRRSVQALFRLKGLVDEVPLTVSDPGVAAVKIAWWQEEFARLDAGLPRHPLTTWLHAADGPTAGAALATWAETALDRVRAPAPPTLDAATAALTDGATGLVAHYVGVVAGHPDSVDELAHLVALTQLGWETLRLGAIERSGCRLTPGAAEEAPPLATLAHALAAASDALPRHRRRAHRTPVTLARLTAAALDQARQQSPYDLRRERPEPAPLIKLGIAFRTRMRG